MRFVFLILTTTFFTVALKDVFATLRPNVLQDTSLAVQYDVSPQFPGGLHNWQQFLRQNFNVNRVAAAMDSAAYVNYGLRQSAELQFTVCENGELCDVEVINNREVSPEFAQEALRLMKRSPRWEPARAAGNPVRVRLSQSITLLIPD